MIRAVILGFLMPASADAKRGQEIFLKILTMDEEGLWRRKVKSLSIRQIFDRLIPEEQLRWFDMPVAREESGKEKITPKLKKRS
jgi:putative DNA methylase